MKNTLIFDIETVIKEPDFFKLSENLQSIWNKKFINRFPELEIYKTEQENLIHKYNEKSGLFSLYNKIVCISFKSLKFEKVTSIFGDCEKTILIKFFDLLYKYNINKLIGMNIFSFDIPQLRQKGLRYKLKMPFSILSVNSKTTWRTNHEDIMSQFSGSSNEWISLPYICEMLGVESPKDQMEGSEVSDAYYNNKLNEIVAYCEKDVLATEKCYTIINF